MQKHSPNVAFVDDFDKYVIRNTECRNYVEEMPVEEKNSGRESRHCYLEVKVPERSTGVLGYWTLDVLHAHDMDRQHLNNLYVLARR